MIFRNGNTVKGLTTAAGIWATAGIGLAIGSGMYWLGVFVTAAISILQYLMHRFTVGADSYVSDLLKVTASGNIQLAEGTELEEGATYKFVLDLTSYDLASNTGAVLHLQKL